MLAHSGPIMPNEHTPPAPLVNARPPPRQRSPRTAALSPRRRRWACAAAALVAVFALQTPAPQPVAAQICPDAADATGCVTAPADAEQFRSAAAVFAAGPAGPCSLVPQGPAASSCALIVTGAPLEPPQDAPALNPEEETLRAFVFGGGVRAGHEDGVWRWRHLVMRYFGPQEWDTALCVMSYESGGNPTVVYANPGDPHPDGIDSVGLMQVDWDNLAGRNRVNGLRDWGDHTRANAEEALLDPATNVRAAAAMHNADGWLPHWRAQEQRCGLTRRRSKQRRHGAAHSPGTSCGRNHPRDVCGRRLQPQTRRLRIRC